MFKEVIEVSPVQGTPPNRILVPMQVDYIKVTKHILENVNWLADLDVLDRKAGSFPYLTFFEVDLIPCIKVFQVQKIVKGDVLYLVDNKKIINCKFLGGMKDSCHFRRSYFKTKRRTVRPVQVRRPLKSFRHGPS